MVKALVFLATGFEEIETVTVVDVLRRAGITVVVASLTANVVEGAHKMKVVPDKVLYDVNIDEFDAVIAPGGSLGYRTLRKDPQVLDIIQKAFNENKLVAAICGAPAVLADAGILNGKECTIFPDMDDELIKGGGKPKPDMVVVDGNVITVKHPRLRSRLRSKLWKN
jgi:4-methyl-5(b-hydroxyethyl)-thiazole monophosphate biosynthesis